MAKKKDDKVVDQTVQEVVDNSSDQLKQLEAKVISLEDQLKRAVADYRNLERRVQEDSLTIASYLKVELLHKILPVLDNLDQAVDGASELATGAGWLKGVQMSLKQFHQVLSEEGVSEVPSTDQFDPKLHEAVDTQIGEDGKILKVLQKGYILNSRVFRPAKVVVGKQGDKNV